MSKPITLSPSQWEKLKIRLTNDYSPSTLLISYKMKEKLGFSVRTHQWYVENRGYQSQICLDFYNEPKRTMFLLKYSEYLEPEKLVKYEVW
jgi:hypothetical protein